MIIPITAPNCPPGNVDIPAIPDHMPEVSHPDVSVEASAVMEDTLGWRFTISRMAKLLCGVRDSVNAFTPLKSVAGCLCFILENCKVCLLSM